MSIENSKSCNFASVLASREDGCIYDVLSSGHKDSRRAPALAVCLIVLQFQRQTRLDAIDCG